MRFTLRRLFVITAACAVAIALLLWATESFRRQRAIRVDLMRQGAAWVGFSSNAPDCKPNVMFNQPITFDFQNYESLKCVELKGYKVSNSCLSHLSKLRQVDGLFFVSCNLDCDLSILNTIAIEQLMFWGTNVTDESLESIAKIRGLKIVIFNATKVTTQGVEQLEAALPGIEVVLRP